MTLTPHLTKPFKRSQCLPLLLHPSYQSAISTLVTQEVPDVNLPGGRCEPCEDNPPDPVLDSPSTGNDSDTCSVARRSPRERRRPARYDGFVMDRN